jgi:hypothetical protein
MVARTTFVAGGATTRVYTLLLTPACSAHASKRAMPCLLCYSTKACAVVLVIGYNRIAVHGYLYLQDGELFNEFWYMQSRYISAA